MSIGGPHEVLPSHDDGHDGAYAVTPAPAPADPGHQVARLI